MKTDLPVSVKQMIHQDYPQFFFWNSIISFVCNEFEDSTSGKQKMKIGDNLPPFSQGNWIVDTPVFSKLGKVLDDS
jgi:hypothetical protein